MTMKWPAADAAELPFKLETQLERDIAANPDWLEGVAWGRPRPGHPEGKVMFHIRDVLRNIDHFFGGACDRSRLRLIALLHDTFKYKVVRAEPGARQRSHGYRARKFAERYIDDAQILAVIELHDGAYQIFLGLTRHGHREVAEGQARELMMRLDQSFELFMRFYLCDSRTGDKSMVHYAWFKGLAEKMLKEGRV
ncbi:MAG: hypothetical protein ACE5H9_13490 [Anaerolineae bacterium]